MSKRLSIALVQSNFTVGAIDSNAQSIRTARQKASERGADLVVFGELAIAGYPPEDLVCKSSFIRRVKENVEILAQETADGGSALLFGAPWAEDGKLFNSALLLDGGNVQEVRHKHHLPNYGVFDEKRLFDSGPLPMPIKLREISLGVMVCEDMWFSDVTSQLKNDGAHLLIALNGSPYDVLKTNMRERHALARVQETGLPMIYINLVGGQDELVFDGSSFVMNNDGTLSWRAFPWREEMIFADFSHKKNIGWRCSQGTVAPLPDMYDSIYLAIVTGLRDYTKKNHFPGIILGLSGGIDSALSAAVAVDALGPQQVLCVMLPSPYTSQESLDDAAACAAMLNTSYHVLPITSAMQIFDTMLTPVFQSAQKDTTEENIQSRIRGLILMALSNKSGHMLLTTGNKSEMSVGYATLYGDTCGGYSVLKDIYKTTVFELAKRRNIRKLEGLLGPDGPVMPESIIAKPPSAELKPGQTDQDSLPSYDVLDDILQCLIENEMSVADTVARGHPEATVRHVWRLLNSAEYKRRQAPPGVKISTRAFGRDRRYPITNGFI